MRGIAHQPEIPLFKDRYGLRPGCIAVYPMYKGLAQLVGMPKLEGPQTIAEEFERYLVEYDNYDYFFIHFKYTDMYGEDGNFAAKKKAIEEFDAALPILLRKKPDVLAITGDHSTPCAMKGHSWHPVPVMLHSACSGSDKLERFTETGANSGSLGVFEAKYLIRLMQAHAKMLDKFGRVTVLGRDAFHPVPLLRNQVRDAVERVPASKEWPNWSSTSKPPRCRWSSSTKRNRNTCSANARELPTKRRETRGTRSCSSNSISGR